VSNNSIHHVAGSLVMHPANTDQWDRLCDRLERLGVQFTTDGTPNGISITDGKRHFELIDILDRFADLMKKAA
jgi:hypothetical protein